MPAATATGTVPSARRRSTSTPEIQIANLLHQIATNRVHRALGCQQARSLRCCLLDLEKLDGRAFPYTG